ncbi:hypothetical protein ABHA01_06070 [Clostridium paraputrificum]|uniref:hypothetical protein n=1 Tax=Clostridium paraputrificum TaxID=29363 RepID=UPI00325B9F99
MKYFNRKYLFFIIIFIFILGFLAVKYMISVTLNSVSNFSKSITLNSYYVLTNTSAKEYKVITNETSEVVIPEYINSYKISVYNIYLKQTPRDDTKTNYWAICNDKIIGPMDNVTFYSKYKVDSNTFEKIIP